MIVKSLRRLTILCRLLQALPFLPPLLAERQGFPAGAVYDESRSARIPGRPVFARLLEEILRGRAAGVLCWKLDRLARNPVDGGALIWALDSGKLGQIVTPERTYENTAGDKFWLQLEFGMAKKYVDDLSENVKRGNRAKLEQGWVPGIPPIGYLNDRMNKTIVPDPDRFPLIRRAWELVLTGTPPLKVLEQLNDSWGLRTRRFARTGGRPLSRSSLYTLLRNRFYYGLLERDGQLYRGAHVPMVSKEEFDRVQTMLTGKRRATKRHSFRYGHLLTCGSCGASITAEIHVKWNGKRYTYYHCTRRRGNCRERAISEPLLDEQIHGILARLDAPRASLPSVLDRLFGKRPNPAFAHARDENRARTRDYLPQRCIAFGLLACRQVAEDVLSRRWVCTHSQDQSAVGTRQSSCPTDDPVS